MNVPQILAYDRELINDPESSQVTDATLMLYLREAYNATWDKFRNLHEDFGITFFDVQSSQFTDIGAGVLAFFLPSTINEITRVERDDGNTGRVGLVPITINEKDFYYNQSTRITGDFGVYWQMGDRLCIRSDTPAASIRVYYVRRWPALHSGLAQAVFAAGTIVFPAVPTLGEVSTEDSFYNDSIVRIIAGTGVGQERRIASYVGATRTATLSTPWTVVPDATSQYSMMPEFPENHHRILCYMTAEVWQIRRGNAKQLQTVRTMRAEVEEEMLSGMKTRQDQEPRQVIDRDDAMSE